MSAPRLYLSLDVLLVLLVRWSQFCSSLLSQQSFSPSQIQFTWIQAVVTLQAIIGNAGCTSKQCRGYEIKTHTQMYTYIHIYTQKLNNVTWRVTWVETTQVICLTLIISPVFKTYFQNGLTLPKVAVLKKWHSDTSKIIFLKIVTHIRRCVPISQKLLVTTTVSTQTSLY